MSVFTRREPSYHPPDPATLPRREFVVNPPDPAKPCRRLGCFFQDGVCIYCEAAG